LAECKYCKAKAYGNVCDPCADRIEANAEAMSRLHKPIGCPKCGSACEGNDPKCPMGITRPVAPTPYPDNNPKSVVGTKKPGTWAIPPVAILHLGAAMEDGVAKYGLVNWRSNSVAASVYGNAIDRHMLAWRDGQNNAADSGKHHLAHVMACCAILLDAEAQGVLIDDRGTPGKVAEIIEAWTKKTG
jgi:hypothetical protein